ncbi:MAG: polar amino acid transport system substrate-binding protein, partial [Halioglobus sp.]
MNRISRELVKELAPQGILRAGINMSNFLLVSETRSNGEINGVSPQMAAAIAAELSVELQLTQYQGPGDVADAAQTNGWDI